VSGVGKIWVSEDNMSVAVTGPDKEATAVAARVIDDDGRPESFQVACGELKPEIESGPIQDGKDRFALGATVGGPNACRDRGRGITGLHECEQQQHQAHQQQAVDHLSPLEWAGHRDDPDNQARERTVDNISPPAHSPHV
jgi:hypothetical protein